MQFSESLTSEHPLQLAIDDSDSVRLRLLQADDGEMLHQFVMQNPYLQTYLQWTRDYTSESAEATTATVRQQVTDMAHGERLQYWIIEGSGRVERMLGSVMLFGRVWTAAKLGYYLAQEAQHKGYMTRAARALTKYSFDEWELDYAMIEIRDSNLASTAVAQRLGARPTGNFMSNDGEEPLRQWVLEEADVN